ncbi:MAG: hypothetical protein WDO16_18545 [Bacteroidota bacterium]
MKEKSTFLFRGSLLLFAWVLLSWSHAGKPGREYYQFTVYHYSNDVQEKMLDNYLQQALLPALHRMDITYIGVFKAIANDTSATKSLYVLLPVKSLDMLTKIPVKLSNDKEYQSAGAEYINAVYYSITVYPYGNCFNAGISAGSKITGTRAESGEERQGV